jgi:anti-sigma factor RsiW
MAPEKFFDYLEGKLPPAEKERLERALIADPELQREFVAARQIHRGLQRPAGETAATARAGSRGRQLAAAFAVLVAMNVALGLLYIFRANKPPETVQKAREEALRYQLQSSVEKSAAAAFPPPTIGMEVVALATPRGKQDEVAKTIIDAATKAGGSGTKGLPNENGFSVLVIVPASGEPAFRETLTALGAAPPPRSAAATPPPSPNGAIRLEIVLSSPR